MVRVHRCFHKLVRQSEPSVKMKAVLVLVVRSCSILLALQVRHVLKRPFQF